MRDRARRLRRRQPDLGAQGASPRSGAELFDAGGAGTISTARDGIVVPGVGHFRRDARARRRVARRHPATRSTRGVPLLGICLGMQWLFEGSDEAPDVPGLGAHRRAAARRLPPSGESPARRLELARASRDRRGCSTGVRTRHAGLLHAFVRRATHATTRSPRRPMAMPLRVGRRDATTSSACSFTRRSPATAGLRILRELPLA